MNDNSQPRDADPEQLLREIVTYGERRHILRQLEARRSMSDLDAADIAHEVGAETDDPARIARIFIEEYDVWRNDLPDDLVAEDDEYREQTYGDRADGLMEASR